MDVAILVKDGLPRHWTAKTDKFSLVFRSSRAAAHVRCKILLNRTHNAWKPLLARRLYFCIFSYCELGLQRYLRGIYSQKEDMEHLLKDSCPNRKYQSADALSAISPLSKPFKVDSRPRAFRLLQHPVFALCFSF